MAETVVLQIPEALPTLSDRTFSIIND